jgi:hypothetical protein
LARHLEDPPEEGSSLIPGRRWVENQRMHIGVLVTAYRDEFGHDTQRAALFQKVLQPTENTRGPDSAPPD